MDRTSNAAGRHRMHRAGDGWRRGLREAALDALSVVAPTSCSGCGRADRAICGSCAAALMPATCTMHPVAAPTGGALPVYCALEYTGVARHVLLALKETGRTDAAGPLGPAMLAAIGSALHGRPEDGVELAVIPSSRAAFRRRGYHPVRLVLAAAGLRAARILRAVRQTADQSGLGAGARGRNRAGSLRARGRLTGRAFLVVDDILTTGATIAEARRAIEAAGGTVLAGAVLAHTRRLRPIASDVADSLPVAGDFSASGHYGWVKGVDDPPS